MGTEAEAAAAAAAASAAAASKPWHAGVPGVDETLVGHWQNKGWDKKSAAEVAVEATRAAMEAQKFVGVPANQLLRLPKEAGDEAGWKPVWQRLGVPADPKEYNFADVKRSDGSAPEESFIETMRAAAFRHNIPKEAANAITREVVKFMENSDTSESAGKAARIAEQKAALLKNWGPNFEANKFVAGRAATTLGIDPATVASLENVIGYDKIMEMFRAIGAKTGEDKYVTSGAPGAQGGVMTREQAVAKKGELMADPVWKKAYLSGGMQSKEFREMQALEILIVGRAA